jgi:Family of unknown function (DUF5343)
MRHSSPTQRHKEIPVSDEKKTITLPYVSFKTILNMADRLAPEPPPRIDRSVVAYLSGGYQTQVISASKTLGLIDEAGVPSADFVSLVTAPAGRKPVIRRVWERTYADIFSAVDVGRATADQLSEAFGNLGMAGDTRTKAIIFFIHGAKFAEIPLSTHVAGGIRRVRGPIRVKRQPKAEGPADLQVPATSARNGSAVVQVAVHPMLQGAITWLAENGPTWSADQQKVWSANFTAAVALVYPARERADAE